ncbi:hypothetical protein CASFOL_029999 [Castilleja foliolosa]|uniref:Myb-like domain-containing protein n=1 Tax=Castilleja foliolosa TaxID=1961234 RepID=A0ABD3C9E1_9LAMI
MASDFDPLDDMLADGAVNKAKTVGKFQPKAKFRPTKKVSFATSVSTSQGVQTIDSTQSELIEPSKPCSVVVPNNNEGSHAFMEKSTVENSEAIFGSEVPGDTDNVVLSSNGHDQTHDKELVREENDAFDSNNTAKNDSIPTFQEDDVIDLPSVDFTHTLPTESTSECPSNEKPMNLEGVREIPKKLATRRAKTASFPSPQKEKASPLSRENEIGRTLRSRKSKTNACELVDEDVELSAECVAVHEENINNNEEFQAESEPKKKKRNQKSKKTNTDIEKPGRKRKKTSSDQDVVAMPKKLSRSTRRTRVVDKALLAIPDDELDYDTVPLRDLLARAEHIEKQMKKAATATKKSNGDSSILNTEEDETFISKQGGEYNDGEEGSPIAEDTTENFNYQTYMDKTHRTRWSKEDTEMFYNAVRQMGTDLAMIQQLFPGRTRRQLKLKYKKEEREHPMRLHDALTSRSKDNSYFEMIIENLEQEKKRKQAEEKQNDDEDGSIDLTCNGDADEETTIADDEEPKDDEHDQEEENDDVANDDTEVQSPSKPDDAEDDDLFSWDQYTSM